MTLSEMPDLPLSQSGKLPLTVCREAAGQAGALIKERFLTDKEVRFKGRADIVTDVDLAAEKVILDLVRPSIPNSVSSPRNPIPLKPALPTPGSSTPLTAPATLPRVSPISAWS